MIQRFGLRCEPPRWARGGHAQTLLGHFLPCPGAEVGPVTAGVRRRVIDLEDGDRLCVFDAAPIGFEPSDGASEAKPLANAVVHLFHGLTGSSDSNYVRLTADILRRAGAHVVAFNHRGQGHGDGLARGIYHSGSAPDMWASIAAARALHPRKVHLAVGFSLSGNALLLGAGRDRDLPGAPDAVLAINPPVLLSAAVDRIERGMNRLYDRNFVRGIRRAMHSRIERGLLEPRYRVSTRWSVRRADHLVTAPLAGFDTGAEYYEHCSSAPWVGSIRVPTVILTSADDPFIHPSDVEDAAMGSEVLVHVEETGGHLGYLHADVVAADGPAAIARRRWLGAATLHYATRLTSAASLAVI
ncbi:MAG: alpha/beta fold hydrolase [Planctomycetota bacterium]